jgi:transcriptional regulator with XRE-family HTH domain
VSAEERGRSQSEGISLAAAISYDLTSSFPERLARFRKEHGLSYQALADKIGTAIHVVRRWELGTSKPAREFADKLTAIGFGPISEDETNIASRSRIKRSGEIKRDPHAFRVTTAELTGATLPSWAVNGPPDQGPFHEKLLRLQLDGGLAQKSPERLSMLDCYAPGQKTLQSLLESPKANAASWNSNYGSHGWHRYVGRFPPHVVRALLNHFGVGDKSLVCDPFTGSGTTAVECRLLGIPFVGIEIGALSHLMSCVKAGFETDTRELKSTAEAYKLFIENKTYEFEQTTLARSFAVTDVLERAGNPIPSFQNIEKWFTPEAFLGVSLTVEFARQQKGFLKDAILLALSAKMRSIGNVDVDVVRAEYSRHPRQNVNVGRLVYRQLSKMVADIEAMKSTHKTLGSNSTIRLIEGSALSVELPEASVDAVVTSPPYGVEALSYLRTHLLSYRSLASELDHDPYETRDQTIGSEYLEESVLPSELRVAAASATFREFFDSLANVSDKKTRQRRAGMMKFFEDMHCVGERLAFWLKDGGRIAWIVGNKRLGDSVIPTDKIIEESFRSSGLGLYDVTKHKLKTNNSNSQVPWQERIIQEEAIMLFERFPRS